MFVISTCLYLPEKHTTTNSNHLFSQFLYFEARIFFLLWCWSKKQSSKLFDYPPKRIQQIIICIQINARCAYFPSHSTPFRFNKHDTGLNKPTMQRIFLRRNGRHRKERGHIYSSKDLVDKRDDEWRLYSPASVVFTEKSTICIPGITQPPPVTSKHRTAKMNVVLDCSFLGKWEEASWRQPLAWASQRMCLSDERLPRDAFQQCCPAPRGWALKTFSDLSTNRRGGGDQVLLLISHAAEGSCGFCGLRQGTELGGLLWPSFGLWCGWRRTRLLLDSCKSSALRDCGFVMWLENDWLLSSGKDGKHSNFTLVLRKQKGLCMDSVG